VARFLLGAGALALLYLVLAPVLWLNRGVVEDGPLSFSQPALTSPLAPAHPLAELEATCEAQEPLSGAEHDRVKVVGGRVDGRLLYGCFAVSSTGAVAAAAVLDQDLLRVKDVSVLQRSGAWRWLGAVKTRTELVLGFLGLVAILGMYLLYYRRPRPGPRVGSEQRWWHGRAGDVVVLCLLGLAVLWGWLGGRALIRGEGWGYPDRVQEARPQAGCHGVSPSRSLPPAGPPLPPRRPRRRADPPTLRSRRRAPRRRWSGRRPLACSKVQRPDQLPTFADVGGMTMLKDLPADTFGLLLASSEEAERYRITFNGILLHGPPGVGKTFVARATAGEFVLNFVHVVTGDLISKWLGESAKNVAAAFRYGAATCLACCSSTSSTPSPSGVTTSRTTRAGGW
jgi:hypothetical protein